MKLTFVRKWADSNSNNCPALYDLGDGRYVVQGWKLNDPADRAQLRDLGLDEDAVIVPADVIAGIRAAA